MKAVVQRVSAAEVHVIDPGQPPRLTGRIDQGLCVLLGVAADDSRADSDWMASRIAGLRVFEDAAGKMNLDVGQAGGAVLCVSQFTLLGELSRGRRPSFGGAMAPGPAALLFDATCEALERRGLRVARGEFRTTMRVSLRNEGPATFCLDSRDALSASPSSSLASAECP